MSGVEIWRIVRRRWWIVAATTLVGLVAGYGYAHTTPKSYQATSQVYVTMATGTSVNDAYQGALAAQQRVVGYTQLVTSTSVAEAVINELSLPETPAELQGHLSASFTPGTALITINVTEDSAAEAKAVNDAVVTQFRALVGQLERTVVGAAPAAQIKVVNPALEPSGPSASGLGPALGAGGLVGLLLGALLALLAYRFDNRIRTASAAEQALSAPIALTMTPCSDDAERTQSRRLRDLISRGGTGATSCVGIVGLADADVMWVARDTAEAFARSGKAVVVIDADRGVADHAADDDHRDAVTWAPDAGAALPERIPESEVTIVRLDVDRGEVADVIVGRAFADAVAGLAERADIVLMVTPRVRDGVIELPPASLCDFVIGVVPATAARRGPLRRAYTQLVESGVSLRALVVAAAAPKRSAGPQRATAPAADDPDAVTSPAEDHVEPQNAAAEAVQDDAAAKIVPDEGSVDRESPVEEEFENSAEVCEESTR